MPEAAAKSPPRFLPSAGYAFMLLFMFAVPGLRQFTDEFNRTMWSLNIYMIVIHFVLIALVALLLAAGWTLALRRAHEKPRRLARALLFAALAGSVGTILLIKLVGVLGLDGVSGWMIEGRGNDWAAVGITAAVAPVLFAAPGLLERVSSVARFAAKLFSPLPVILLVTFATYPQHSLEYQSPPPATQATGRPAPVLLIVMDALDRGRSVDDPAVMARLPNLSAFVDGARNFSRTSTPSQRTRETMPAVLHQDATAHWADAVTSVVTRDGVAVPVAEVPTWFDLVGREGDTRAMIGFHLDYTAMVGGRVDWLRTSGIFYANPAESVSSMLRSHLYAYAAPTSVPFLTNLEIVQGHVSDRYDFIAHDVHASTLHAIREYGPSLVGVFHYVPPHPPWMYDRDGRRPLPPDLTDDEGYVQNLEYGDRLIGEVFDELRKHQLWDAATVIITGDHGYPWDDETRVPPIIIKLPGQNQARTIETPLSTTEIASWLHQQPEFTALRPAKSGQD